MLISLQKQATTRKIRAAIQASDEPAWILAERFGADGREVAQARQRPRSQPHDASVADDADPVDDQLAPAR